MSPDEYTERDAKAFVLATDLTEPKVDEAYVVWEWLTSKPQVWVFVGVSPLGAYTFRICAWDEAESSDADSDEWKVTIPLANRQVQLKQVSSQGWIALGEAHRVKYVGQTTFVHDP